MQTAHPLMNKKIHFQNDIFNGWEEDGEPIRKYEPHVLEIPTPENKVISEKTIFLDPTKYKFNKQTKQEGIIERFLRWLLIG